MLHARLAQKARPLGQIRQAKLLGKEQHRRHSYERRDHEPLCQGHELEWQGWNLLVHAFSLHVDHFYEDAP